MSEYQQRVTYASEAQGITQISKELELLGVKSEIDQTGGFCMVGRVQVSEEDYPYIGFTSECMYIYRNDDHEGDFVMEFDYNMVNGEAIADFKAIASAVDIVAKILSSSEVIEFPERGEGS